MSNNLKKIIYCLILFLLWVFYFAENINAENTSSGFGISAPMSDTLAGNADIICSYKEGNQRCKTDYDTSIFGVISEQPAVAIEDPELKNSHLVVTSGVVKVKVNSSNGNIKEGDFITSSKTPGVGIKATKNGFVVGSAIEDYQSANTQAVGTIQMTVNVHPESSLTGSRGNLLQFIRSGISVPIFSPIESLRYLLAVAIVLISFTLGMIYFGRASRAGIEAIGRNPLAKRVIQFTVIMNIVLTLIIVLVGLGIAYLILVL